MSILTLIKFGRTFDIQSGVYSLQQLVLWIIDALGVKCGENSATGQLQSTVGDGGGMWEGVGGGDGLRKPPFQGGGTLVVTQNARRLLLLPLVAKRYLDGLKYWRSILATLTEIQFTHLNEVKAAFSTIFRRSACDVYMGLDTKKKPPPGRR